MFKLDNVCVCVCVCVYTYIDTYIDIQTVVQPYTHAYNCTVVSPRHMQVSEASQLLAMILFGLNRLEEAEKAMGTSLKLREQIVGKDHPTVAEALLHMSKITLRLGRNDEARDLQLRANKLMGARTRKSIRQSVEADDQQQQR